MGLCALSPSRNQLGEQVIEWPGQEDCTSRDAKCHAVSSPPAMLSAHTASETD